MARNSEKAKAMLNRWVAMKRGYVQQNRPRDPNSVANLALCLKWRRSVVKSIIRKIAILQNASLAEPKIRGINDSINRMLYTKERWERRIVELSGPDFRQKSEIVDGDGRSVPYINGKFYFGVSKLLPGVKEKIEGMKGKTSKKRTKEELLKHVDTEYYGLMDNDSELLEIEKKSENYQKKKINDEWKRMTERSGEEGEFLDLDFYVPSLEEMQIALLEKRKRDVIRKYQL